MYFAGRAFGIVPRQIKPEGYVDLDHDSPKEGSMLYFFEAASQRKLPMESAHT